MSENATRMELFNALQSLGDSIPEMRLGQLMAAVVELCVDLHGRGLWDAADTELLEAVWQFHRNIEAAAGAPDTHEAELADERERQFWVGWQWLAFGPPPIILVVRAVWRGGLGWLPDLARVPAH